jgi:DNA-binding XRE family transcriptional regulator
VANLGSMPDVERRRLMLELRQQGLSLGAIGERLGVTRQCVHSALRRIREAETDPGITCCRCGQRVAQRLGPMRASDPVFCRACLTRMPGATFAERLRSFRLAAGLTQKDLATRSGVDETLICNYERGRHYPRPDRLAKLERVTGRAASARLPRRAVNLTPFYTRLHPLTGVSRCSWKP